MPPPGRRKISGNIDLGMAHLHYAETNPALTNKSPLTGQGSTPRLPDKARDATRRIMAKLSRFVCQACGAATSKWAGRCDNCGEWNAIIEESASVPLSGAKGVSLPKGQASRLVGLQGETATLARVESGIGELDRALGGGLVPASGVLIGGDPGIGKSTLLLQALAALARRGRRVIYVSGEEAVAQVRLRASRLALSDAPVLLATETNVSDILATLNEGEVPAVAVIDSVQTIWSP